VKQDENPPVQIVFVPATGGNVTKVPWPEKALMSRVPGGGHNLSPYGQKLIVSASEEPYGPKDYMDLWVIPLDDGLPVRLTNDEAPENYPCWSPDGKWIAFKVGRKQLLIRASTLFTGSPLKWRTYPDHFRERRCWCRCHYFSLDGKRIVFSRKA
jgi:Tol biopolymer transport system component